MNTAAILVEILVIGFQVTIWLFLLITSIFGNEMFDIDGIKKMSTLLTIVSIPIFYTLGVMFDVLFYSKIMSKIEKRISKKLLDDKDDISLLNMVVQCYAKNGDIVKLISERLGRLRLARASSFNIVIITISILIFIKSIYSEIKIEIYIAVLFFGIISSIAVIFSWIKLYKNYVILVRECYKVVIDNNKHEIC